MFIKIVVFRIFFVLYEMCFKNQSQSRHSKQENVSNEEGSIKNPVLYWLNHLKKVDYNHVWDPVEDIVVKHVTFLIISLI